MVLAPFTPAAGVLGCVGTVGPYTLVGDLRRTVELWRPPRDPAT